MHTVNLLVNDTDVAPQKVPLSPFKYVHTLELFEVTREPEHMQFYIS